MNEVLYSGGWAGTGEVQLQHLKKFFKTFEKPLDKPHKVWYNKYVKRKEQPQKTRKGIEMKIDLQKPWEERNKYDKCVTYLMNDDCPLRSLRNRLMALQAITEKVAPDATFTSKEIGAAPMALAALCIHQDGDFWSGFAPIKVVEQKECFINLHDNKYLKVYYNVYKSQWTLEEIKDFVNAVCEAYGIILGK